MTINPYREHMDHIQATMRQVDQEFRGSVPFDMKNHTGAYGMNFASVTGAAPYESELQRRIDAKLAELNIAQDRIEIYE